MSGKDARWRYTKGGMQRFESHVPSSLLSPKIIFFLLYADDKSLA
jgi:hypothetical protein